MFINGGDDDIIPTQHNVKKIGSAQSRPYFDFEYLINSQSVSTHKA